MQAATLDMMTARSIYDIEVDQLDGGSYALSSYAGRPLLVVNTASKCGFTPQLAGLEWLHRRYAERGLVVLGFPCNQFGKQEPGDAAQIGRFCRDQYEVTFPLHAKIRVNGTDAHPLFEHLKAAKPGLLGIRAIKWNFTKFLVSADGRVVGRYAPATRPQALTEPIEKLL